MKINLKDKTTKEILPFFRPYCSLRLQASGEGTIEKWATSVRHLFLPLLHRSISDFKIIKTQKIYF